MTLAAVHLPLWQTLAAAILIAAWAVWYWLRQGRSHVPTSRRMIRRTSMVLVLLALPVFVRGLSVVDPDIDGGLYIQTWIIAMVVVGLLAISALVDGVNTIRIHANLRAEEAHEAAHELGQLMRQRTAGKPAADTSSGTHGPQS